MSAENVVVPTVVLPLKEPGKASRVTPINHSTTSEEEERKKNKRRKHKKSRNGCFNCKKLRIKCDEHHPICKNCELRQKDCVWPSATRIKNGGSNAVRLSPTELATSALAHSTSKESARPTSMSRMFDVDFADLELLRFYVEHTSPLLIRTCGDADYSWIRSIPSMTLVNPALYKCVLTLASIHKAHMFLPETYTYEEDYAQERKELEKQLETLRLVNSSEPLKLPPPDMTRVIGYVKPDSHLLENIVKAFTEALSGHRNSLATLNASNQESILSTSVIIFMIALSLGELIPLVSFDGGADLIGVGRGVIELVFQLSAKDRTSLFPLPAPNPKQSSLPNEETLWTLISTIPNQSHRQMCSMEFQQLIELYNLDVIHRGQNHLPGWATYISGGFLQACRSRDPYCLIILGHYCAYSHTSHSSFWLRDRLIVDLEAIIDALPTEFHHYLEWPKSICGRFDLNYEDLTSGKLRDMILKNNSSMDSSYKNDSQPKLNSQMDLLQQQQLYHPQLAANQTQHVLSHPIENQSYDDLQRQLHTPQDLHTLPYPGDIPHCDITIPHVIPNLHHDLYDYDNVGNENPSPVDHNFSILDAQISPLEPAPIHYGA